METRTLTAIDLQQDDWFFLAGNLYRITAIYIEQSPISGRNVQIWFEDKNRQDVSIPSLVLSLKGDTPFQILNQ